VFGLHVGLNSSCLFFHCHVPRCPQKGLYVQSVRMCVPITPPYPSATPSRREDVGIRRKQYALPMLREQLSAGWTQARSPVGGSGRRGGQDRGVGVGDDLPWAARAEWRRGGQAGWLGPRQARGWTSSRGHPAPAPQCTLRNSASTKQSHEPS
jgi:hypothetical protein